MFENKSPGAQTKIIDFGLSKKFSGAPKFMGERVGTIYTMSPQVLQGIYNSKADLWSIGVITYMLLCTSKPFYDRNRRRMIEMIEKGIYKRDGLAWDNLSLEAKDFVQRLLVVDPNRRMNAAQALQHPWLVNRAQLPNEKPSSEVLASIDDALTSYVHTSALKKLALMIIAHRSTAPSIEALRSVFEEYDTSRDGVISFAELRAVLARCDFPDEEIHKVFASIVRQFRICVCLYDGSSACPLGLTLLTLFVLRRTRTRTGRSTTPSFWPPP
jgi:serine/threonine protein kinase